MRLYSSGKWVLFIHLKEDSTLGRIRGHISHKCHWAFCLIVSQAEHPLTYWMWLTIARPWQRIPQESLDGTRNALMKMIRAQHPGLTVEERKDGELSIDTMLEVLLHGSRSASWTQKHGHRWVTYLKKTFGSVPAQRVNQIGCFPDALHGSTRSWSGWVNRAFIGKSADFSDDGGLPCKEKACAAANAKLVPLNMVLDRMPPYLVVSHGFENIGEEQLRTMFDDIEQYSRILPNLSGNVINVTANSNTAQRPVLRPKAG